MQTIGWIVGLLAFVAVLWFVWLLVRAPLITDEDERRPFPGEGYGRRFNDPQ